MPKKTATDETDTKAASHVTDHPFTPRGEWWSVCKECGLAEAAHQNTTLKPEDRK